MRAKTPKNGISEIQQNCLELLMKEQIATQEKLELEEEIMRLQLQANLQDAQIKKLNDKLYGKGQKPGQMLENLMSGPQ